MPNQHSTARGTPRARAGAAGVVVSVTAEGNLTLRGADLPEGTLVRDPSGRYLGRVVRVFGPVREPYLSVRPRRTPATEEVLSLLGATMVVKEG